MTHYEYSDGNMSCGHRHRTEGAARTCPGHLYLIRAWWESTAPPDEDAEPQAFREFRERCIAEAAVIETVPVR